MKLSLTLVITLVTAVLAKDKNTHQPKFSTISPNLAEIEAAAATAVSNQYTSPKVPGCVFDNYYQIWLENTDYEKAFEQEDLAWLRTQGVTLTNYWSLTHPSEPNYVGVVGGDYFGINNDDFFRVPSNVSTVVDLLETKGISWSEYQEHQPYTGFEGFNFSRQSDYAKDYVRKHNPLVIYDSVVDNENRLRNLKNFTEFDKDLKAKQLPQWTFITPNMTNDAHDTDIDFAGRWVNRWLKPLLSNEEFMKNSLVILTFDENHTKPLENKVLAVLFGGAVPEALKGTTDDTYYSHYSNLATVQANWGLDHLGRGDALANPFKLVADQLNIKVLDHDTTGQYNNKSVKGYFNDERVPIPAPNASVVGVVGNTILPAIAKLWGTEGDIPKVEKANCGKKEVAEANTTEPIKNVNVTQQAEVTSVVSTATTTVGFNSTSSASKTPAKTYASTTIDGVYVTVYTSDCVTTSVNEAGKTVTVNVPKTVTSTVCPKCEKAKETPASTPVAASTTVSKSTPVEVAQGTVKTETKTETKAASTPAASPKTEAKVETSPAAPAPAPAKTVVESKPASSPAAESKPAPAPAPTPAPAPASSKASTPAASPAPVAPVASAASKPAASPAGEAPITPVAQPSQAKPSSPAIAQANGAGKLSLGALALLPFLAL